MLCFYFAILIFSVLFRFMIYVLLCIFAFLYMYIAYICKYIYYCRIFGDKQCIFCKKLHRRVYLLLFKNVLRGNAGWSLRTSYNFFFHSCSILSCFAPQLKLQNKPSLLALYDYNLWCWLWLLWDHILARNHHNKDTDSLWIYQLLFSLKKLFSTRQKAVGTSSSGFTPFDSLPSARGIFTLASVTRFQVSLLFKDCKMAGSRGRDFIWIYFA